MSSKSPLQPSNGSSNQNERRGSARFPCGPDHGRTLIARTGLDELSFGLVRDISPSGVGLLLGRKIEPSSLVALTLVNITRTLTVTQLARVVRATELPSGGGYLLGCTFVNKLGQEDLQALL